MNRFTPIATLLVLTVACHPPSKRIAATLTPTSGPDATTIADFSRNLRAGDDLVAQGNDPAWSLILNPSKNTLHFRTTTGDSVTTTVPERLIDPDGTLRYDVPTDAGRIKLLFRPDSCLDKLSGQRYSYRVEADVRGKTYVGCGESLRPALLLSDNWVLTQFDGKPVTAAPTGREVPRLDIQLTEGRVTGTTGCNRLTGRVRADGQRVQFGPLATTRMACPGDAGTYESAFLNALQTPLTYRIGEGQLTLLRANKPVLIFKKVD